EDGIRDRNVTGVQTCALPIYQHVHLDEYFLLASEAWAELGIIPKDEVKNIRPNARVDAKRIQEIEQETRHDVVAFTRQVSETLRSEERRVGKESRAMSRVHQY